MRKRNTEQRTLNHQYNTYKVTKGNKPRELHSVHGPNTLANGENTGMKRETLYWVENLKFLDCVIHFVKNHLFEKYLINLKRKMLYIYVDD